MYNAEFGDTLTPNDITEYDVAKCVKPEAAKKIYQYLYSRSEEMYRAAPVIQDAQEGVETLRQNGFRVVYATATLSGHIWRAKLNWLIEHGFLPEKRSQPDYIACSDKSLVRSTATIDDSVKNVLACNDAAGNGMLFAQPWNAGLQAGSLVRWSWKSIIWWANHRAQRAAYATRAA